jgi:hypothetical protein
MDKHELLETMKDSLAPSLVRDIEAALPDDFLLASNQNQNQGSMEEISKMKPEVLREIGIGFVGGDEVMDNQNQNQGKMEDLLNLKPNALQNLRTVLTGGGEEVMDNQNINQGTQAAALEAERAKPKRK